MAGLELEMVGRWWDRSQFRVLCVCMLVARISYDCARFVYLHCTPNNGYGLPERTNEKSPFPHTHRRETFIIVVRMTMAQNGSQKALCAPFHHWFCRCSPCTVLLSTLYLSRVSSLPVPLPFPAAYLVLHEIVHITHISF